MTIKNSLPTAKNIVRFFRSIDGDKEGVSRISDLLSPVAFGALTWSELFKSMRILIIAEAGAGKTYECRQQQQTLFAAGEPAFFLDLATLAQTSPRDMLNPQEEARLDAWLASSSRIATFFLDSIDELKLTRGSFKQALIRLGRMLVGRLGDVRIVVTTRPVPFDLLAIRRHLPLPETESATAEDFAELAMHGSSSQVLKDAAPNPRIVGLLSLSDEQIRQMAALERVGDVDSLMTELYRRNALDFARRPQDIIELCASWNQLHGLLKHRDQVAQNIILKLAPRREEEFAPLSMNKAQDGARRLALATMLCRKLTMRHSAEADKDGSSEVALDPAPILPDWTENERKTLLERALFGFASYGRVRFHHRSVIECLAAEQLDVLLRQGMPIKAVKRLLFAETLQETLVVRPSMRPVAAWLAGWRPEIFDEILRREPETLLSLGDPESLDASQRRRALRAYVERHGHGGWRGLQTPFVQARRFACSDLAEDINEFWTSGIENPEVRDLLLSLIEAGRLCACENLAIKTALADGTESRERIGAIDALIAIASSELNNIAIRVAETPTVWPDELIEALAPRLFPTHLSLAQLQPILMRIPSRPNHIGGLGWSLAQVIASPEFPPDVLEPLRACLTECIINGVEWERYLPDFVTLRPHLISSLAETCLKLLMIGEKSPELLRSTILALRFGEHDHMRHDQLAELRKAIDAFSPADRAAIFWIWDELVQSIHAQTKPFERMLQALHGDVITLRPERDAGWIKAQLAERERLLDERALLLEIAVRRLCPLEMNRGEHVASLTSLVDDQPDLSAQLEEFLKPQSVDPKIVEWKRKQSEREAQSNQKKAEDRASWIEFWRELAETPDEALRPERAVNTIWNLWTPMKRLGAHDKHANGWNRRFLEAHFSKPTTDEIRTALSHIWRVEPPPLMMEQDPQNRGVLYERGFLGLAALAAESEDPDWARKLSPQEAEVAARYIPVELNSFPQWMASLAAAHPGPVDCMIGGELSFELEASAASPWHCAILRNLANSEPNVAKLFLPRLRRWLDQHEGQQPVEEDANAADARLREVIGFLIRHGDQEAIAHIRTLAENNLRCIGGKYEAVWLTALLDLDPQAGVAAFEQILKHIMISDEAGMRWFALLFGEYRHGAFANLTSKGFTPDLLLRLVRQAYAYVRPADDNRREGGTPYSPNARDRAQDARGAILNALLATTGPEGWAAKLELAEDPEFAHFRDRAMAIALEKAAEDADAQIYAEADVVKFTIASEASPATKDAMRDLLRDRLDDLTELLLEDVSPREEWALIDDEKLMRRAIARHLRDKSNRSYTVDQEGATGDEKETDIRLRSVRGPQAVIELKIGEKKRSAADLLQALREQVVDKYMAAEECQVGCLMITLASNKTWRHPETNASLDFESLICWLDDEARRIVISAGGGIRLFVKGLDLRPRLQTERAKGAAKH